MHELIDLASASERYSAHSLHFQPTDSQPTCDHLTSTENRNPTSVAQHSSQQVPEFRSLFQRNPHLLQIILRNHERRALKSPAFIEEAKADRQSARRLALVVSE
ncbi:MAG: hypothetical protein IIA53_06265 [Chloroflexi bacterium]|nr:hypothetical protein [Chloroflexota bacterium]